MIDYRLKEYKELLEKNLAELNNPMSVPFGMDPYGPMAACYRQWKKESINYALEMMPTSFDVVRWSRRLVEELREENKELKYRIESISRDIEDACVRGFMPTFSGSNYNGNH